MICTPADLPDHGGGGEFPEKALVDPFTGGADDEGELADESSDEDDDTLSFDSTATDRTWMTSAAPPADGLSVMSSGDEADDLNEDDFLTALNSNNNSPPDEQLAKAGNLDDGLGPLPVIKKKSSSRTPSRRTSRDSIQYILESSPKIFTKKKHGKKLSYKIQPVQVDK